MSSTTVAQHTTQPLNFGPEWLRALSTPEATTTTTPAPSSTGNASGSSFKFTATKYRYSRDEILALRSNVTERLAGDVRHEILENLKEVESVFRPNIIEPLTLSTPSAEENMKMNSLSSYISGRTPGGGSRGGGAFQQSQQHDARNARGGGSMSNGRGASSRGRGGREVAFGSMRGNNNNTEENGENGGAGEESSSWSRGSQHSRGGASWNRVRSYDDREQSQPFRRGGGPRQPSEGWRRPRGDDEENNEQNEDSSTPPSTSHSWTSRGGINRRGGGAGTLDQRTKSNEKWSNIDDRSEQKNDSNQQRGWRSNAIMSDRDPNLRRPQAKRDRMPEWMDDNNDDDKQMTSATFEHDGTFMGSSVLRQNSNEPPKFQSQTSTDETSLRGSVPTSKQQEENKMQKPKPLQTGSAAVDIPKASKAIAPEPTPPVQQTISSWEDEFEPSDVATTVVEATLAEDHDYSPPISTRPTPHPLSKESTAPVIPQPQPQQRIQPPVFIDDKQWLYQDPQNTTQGPFSSADMERWFDAGYFTVFLPVKRLGEAQFSTIQQLTKELGHLPFRTDIPSTPQQPPPLVSEAQKFNPMIYPTASAGKPAYVDDYLMQQQQQSRLFNRQTSIDRKQPITSPSVNSNAQLQAYLASQHHQQQQPPPHASASSLFPSNLVNDPSAVYSQQPQIQRSISATNQQPLFDDLQRQFRPISSQSNTSSFFGANIPTSQNQPQQQKPNDIMTRLAQAMQNHGQQQQEKVEEQRRMDQQRHELEIERLKVTQQAEQLRLQREDDERRQLEKQRLEEESRKKKESTANKQTILMDQMKEMAKNMDQKKQQQQQPTPTPPAKVEIDPFLAFQQSVQFQKEQQAKIEAQKVENIRRYQQQQQPREQPQPTTPQQQSFKLPDTVNWARQTSQSNDQNQPLNFAEIQKQEQEHERRAREAAQLMAKSEAINMPHSSSSTKPNSWARTLFAGNSSGYTNQSLELDSNDDPVPESPGTTYNQQATNAPKSRSSTQQQSAPWNAASAVSNTSLQDIQRQQQQSQSESKPPPPPQQPQASSSSSAHSTPAWGGIFQHSTPSPQSSSSLSWKVDQQSSSSASKPTATGGNKSSTPWMELKSAPATKPNLGHADLSKSEREAQHLFSATRTQDALSKWIQTQFKDNLQDIDVPTLVQLLKDIDNAEEIVEYVQPYIGSVIKAREFAVDFISKRKQLSHAEPALDNDRLNALAMTSTSSNATANNTADEGFQLASSNGQKKKAKKMKGQKIDVKQLGFMVNNRPEQRDDIDKVQM